MSTIRTGFCIAIVMAAIMFLAACASVISHPIADKDPSTGGLVYYLPIQRIRITLAVTEDKSKGDAAGDDGKPADGKKSDDKNKDSSGRNHRAKRQAKGTNNEDANVSDAAVSESPPVFKRTITIDAAEPVADTEHPFEAKFWRSQTGTSAFKVKVNSSGLLDGDSGGNTIPQIAAFASAATSAAAGRQLMGVDAQKQQSECFLPGTYVFTLEPTKEDNKNISASIEVDIDSEIPNQIQMRRLARCGIAVAMHPLSGARAIGNTAEGTDHRYQTGFFYRQALPFEVIASDKITHATASFYGSVVSKMSPIHFLHIPKSVFADTTWAVTFAKGSPTIVDLTSGGEVTGALSLPAQVIESYSKALLSGINRRQGLSAAELNYLNSLNALAVAQQNRNACELAIDGGDKDAIRKACAP